MIKEKVIYFLYWVAEFTGVGAYWLDLDFLGVVAHRFPIVGQVMPMVEPIDINRVWHESSWFGAKGKLLILLVVPFVDLEFFKMLGMNPMKDFEKAIEEEAGLDKASFDKTAGEESNMGQEPRRDLRDNRDYRDRGGSGKGGKQALQIGGKLVKAAAFLVIPLLLVFGALTVAGGSGYGSLAQGAVGNQLAPVDFGNAFTMVEQGVQTLQCFGNAACMREWRFNNTERPGSEEVGQSYSLEVDEFSVNNGNELDVAGSRASYSLPVGFSLYNPRHGLKGIEARGTEYRVRVEELGSQDENALCGTDWQTIGGEYSSEIGAESGTIVPGGFATPVSGFNDLNLSSCGLLQPGFGTTKRVALDVNYNYSSQATLYFEAMSEENMRSLGEIPQFKASETADTPVKSFVNVESPVRFRQESGERASRVFRVRLGMNTDRSDIKYRYHTDAFRLFDSEKTVDVETARERQENGERYYEGLSLPESASCQGLEKVQGEDNTYTLSDSAIERAERMYERGEWFSSDSSMSPVSCTMILDPSELSTMSPSGETLTMSIDANYTVKIEKSNDDFRTVNSRCGDPEYDCPLLVPDSKTSEGNVYSECTTENSPDASNGCDVRKGEEWHIVEKINTVDSEIDQGETAYLWNEKRDKLIEGGMTYKNTSNDMGAIGLEQEEFEKLKNNEGYALYVNNQEYDSGMEVGVTSIEGTFCRDTGNGQEFKDWFLENNQYEAILYSNPRDIRCSEFGETSGDGEVTEEDILEAGLAVASPTTYLVNSLVDALSKENFKNEFESKKSDCDTFLYIENGLKCAS